METNGAFLSPLKVISLTAIKFHLLLQFVPCNILGYIECNKRLEVINNTQSWRNCFSYGEQNIFWHFPFWEKKGGLLSPPPQVYFWRTEKNIIPNNLLPQCALKGGKIGKSFVLWSGVIAELQLNARHSSIYVHSSFFPIQYVFMRQGILMSQCNAMQGFGNIFS